MNQCPKCGAQYADVTLRFCLQDGTPLVQAPQAETPTAVLNEIETVVGRGGNGGMRIPIGGPGSEAWRQSQVTHVASTGQQIPPKKGSNTAIAVAVTAVVMVVLFCILGLGAWLVLRNPTNVANNGGPNVNILANNGPTATPTATNSPATTPTRTATPTPQPTQSTTPAPALKSYPSTTRLVMARGSYSTSQ